MKNLLNKILLVALVAVFGVALAGCNPEKDLLPFSVRVVSAGTNSVGSPEITPSFVVTATLDRESKQVLAGPEILTRGFIYVKDNIDIIKEMDGK